MSKRKVEETSLDENPSKRFRSSIIKLCVGGKQFQTSLDTLKSLKGTYFYAQFSSNYLVEDEYFIDRDPTHFMTILNFLRNKKIILSKYSPTDLEEIYEEAKYYSIEPLVKILLPKVACKTIRVTIPIKSEVTTIWDDEELTLDIQKTKKVRGSMAQYHGYRNVSPKNVSIYRRKRSEVSIYYDSDASRWEAHINVKDGKETANFKLFSQETVSFQPTELKWYESVKRVDGTKKVSLQRNMLFKVDLPGEEGCRVEESLHKIATSLSEIAKCSGSNNSGVFQIGGWIATERC